MDFFFFLVLAIANKPALNILKWCKYAGIGQAIHPE